MIVSSIAAFLIIFFLYWVSGFSKIASSYKMWFTRDYWKVYNIVEILSWTAKAIIIIPGLIFGLHIWWLYLFTLLTSGTLIWASNEKSLPTLVAFNTLWVWLSCVVLYFEFFI